MNERKLFIIASVYSCLGVAFGAFGSHLLKDILIANESISTYQTAVSYQFYHSFAIFALAWAVHKWPSIDFRIPAILFIVGILCFSGSLYVFSVTQLSALVFITPIGGILLIVAWLLTIYKLVSDSNEQQKNRKIS